MELTKALRDEYLQNWQTCQFNSDYDRDRKWCADQIEKHRSRYQAISDQTGVPWYVIALLHSMECSGTINLTGNIEN